jgi:hypothetical protein
VQRYYEFRVRWKRLGGWDLMREFRSAAEALEYFRALRDGSPFDYALIERRTITISPWEKMDADMPSVDGDNSHSSHTEA